MRISLPVLKRNAPKDAGPLDDVLRFMQIEPGGSESDLERQAGRSHGTARCVHLGEGAAGALPAIGFLGVGIETDLHRANGQARQPLGNGSVEALAVGFDLE